jgi:hypothetical protein
MEARTSDRREDISLPRQPDYDAGVSKQQRPGTGFWLLILVAFAAGAIFGAVATVALKPVPDFLF